MLNCDFLKQNLSTLLNATVNVNNVGFSFEIANLFSGDDFSLSFIERWFTVIAENKQFLDYDINQLKQIFDSSCLNITSEHELVNAADLWIKHDAKQRGKYAIQLIEKIRLPLLSHAALNSILEGKTSFSECVRCIDRITEVSIKKRDDLINPASIKFKTRYCAQNNFDLLLSSIDSSSTGSSRGIYTLRGDQLPMIEELEVTSSVIDTAVVFVNGVLYFLNDEFMYCYSVLTEQYSYEKMPHAFSDFNAVAFMGNLFVLDGSTTRCCHFEPKTKDWHEIADMPEITKNHSCAVFEGEIVVSGGNSARNVETNTTKAFDFFADKWSQMPDMLQARSKHASVSIRNKLYIVGGSSSIVHSCEMYDSFSRKFVYIKLTSHIDDMWGVFATTPCATMGNKLIVFNLNNNQSDGTEELKSVEYDVETEQFSEENYADLLDSLDDVFIVKVPKL